MKKQTQKNQTIPQHIRDNIIFVDTSAYFALIYEKDGNHEKARNFLELAEKHKLILLTSNFIIAETHVLILRTPSLGYRIAKFFLEDIRTTLNKPERITEEDEERAFEIITKYSDKYFTYTDATSFALMERLGIKRVFTFDNHYNQYGFQKVP